MTEAIWLPGLLVLGVGLAVGLAAAARLRARSRGRGAQRDPQVKLEARDLEARRDELYRRLREESLSAGDRRALEDEAARTLIKLDRLDGGRPRPKPAPEARPESPSAAPAPAAASAASGYRHPLLVGFVFGAALVVLVGLLTYFAVRDAKPREDGQAGMSQRAQPDGEEPHGEEEQLAPEVRQELARLEQQAAASPDDLLALKRLALGRLDAGLYLEAYRDAEEILRRRAEDPDGLFIQGVVRVAMGQNEEALEMLDRVLARFPEHLQAMIYRGLALAQSGAVDQALDTWELGLDMAGGRHPEIERLIQLASEQQVAAAEAAVPLAPPTSGAAAQAPAPPPAAAASGEQPAASDATYRVSIGLAPGEQAPPGGVLFVFLRPAGSGPPVAVQRLESPSFPLEIQLDQRHSMMGAVLPAEGVLVARLDADGSAGPLGPGDLEAQAAAVAGQPLSLLLVGGGG